ncbi:hypothetical protein GCWU000341_02232 [Oribacterium sp. oral taxon 078 str. F0262]|nr:hypothetical protein GCWU000341_02232 [Oribacterium sp. oral taxon 078 str. F0262]
MKTGSETKSTALLLWKRSLCEAGRKSIEKHREGQRARRG